MRYIARIAAELLDHKTVRACDHDESKLHFNKMQALLDSKDPKARQAAHAKVLTPKAIGSGNLTPRDEAMKRLGSLPLNIRNGLAKFDLQLADHVLYAVKAANAVLSVRMFKNDDSKVVGVSNLSKGQLEKDQWFLLTHVRLTSGVQADPLAAAYGVIPLAVSNGDFELKVNGKYLMPKDSSASIFDTTNQADVLRGVYKLANPKWIEPGTDITWDIRFSQASAANTNVKAELIGVQVIPA